MRSLTRFETLGVAVASIPLLAACTAPDTAPVPTPTVEVSSNPSAAPAKLGNKVCASLVEAVYAYGWPDRGPIIDFFGDKDGVYGSTISYDLEESTASLHRALDESGEGTAGARAAAQKVADNGTLVRRSIKDVLTDKNLPWEPYGGASVPNIDESSEYQAAEKFAGQTQALAVETVKEDCIPNDIDSY